MTAIGSVDWGLAVQGASAEAPHYLAAEAAPLLKQLEDVLAQPNSEDGWAIAAVELLAFVALAASRGPAWKGELVYYVTDNQNVKSWLSKRRPRHQLARHLVRLVQRLECAHEFVVTSMYVRTYHNDVADWISLEKLPIVHSTLATKGWTRREPPCDWGQLVADAKDHLLRRLPGEEGPIAEAALRHRALRRPWPSRSLSKGWATSASSSAAP